MKTIGQSMKHEVVSISVLVLHIRDLLELVMPSFVRLVEDFDFVRGDFSVFETLLPPLEVAIQPASSIMAPPMSVRAGSGLLRAFAIMNSHDLYDLLVVDDDDRLVGLASRVDIGTALLANWCSAAAEGTE